MDIIVKLYERPYAEVARYLGTLEVGDCVDVHGPHFTFDIQRYIDAIDKKMSTQASDEAKNDSRPIRIGMIAGGTGIAPMIQLLNRLKDKQCIEIDLLYANRSRDEILLRDEVERLAIELKAKLRIHYFIEYPSGLEGNLRSVDDKNDDDDVSTSNSPLIDWNVGRITDKHAVRYLPSSNNDGSSLAIHPMIFVCGPPGMMRSLCGGEISASTDTLETQRHVPLGGMLKQLGYRTADVYRF